MSLFMTADWHLGEDRWDIMGRPFTDVQEHIDFMVNNHNKLVKPDDEVLMVGDAVYQKADPKFIEQIARFNGVKTLFRGNHDRPFTDEQYAPYFKEIVAEGEGQEMEICGVPCWVQHYPSLGRADRFNICGHIHGVWKVQLNSLNVGVDASHFHPVPAEKVPFFLKAVTEFYDWDCWACYNPVNQSHFVERGKKSHYFVPEKK